MKKALLGLCLALPVTAMAQDFSYDYIDGGYAHTEGDFGLDADGFGAELGWAPSAIIYTKFGAGYVDVDNTSVDGYGFAATVGAHTSLADNVDAYAGLIGEWQRVDAPVMGDVDGYGLGGEIGVRGRLAPMLELDVSGTYENLFAGDLEDTGADTDDWTGGIVLRLVPSDTFSINAGYAYAFDAETDTYTLGARFNF